MYTHNNVVTLIFKCLNDLKMLETKENIAKANKWLQENLKDETRNIRSNSIKNSIRG